MSLKKTEAIILRHRHFRDTSLIFTFYTRDYGKVEALAKGIKKNISRGENGMEIFSQVELIYYERESQTLRLLSHWYLLDSFKSLRISLLKFTYGAYLVELVDSLVHGEEKNEKIYYLLLDSLHSMEKEEDLNRLIHFFELKLIRLLGYSLSLKFNSANSGIIQFLEKADFKTLSRLKISKSDEDKLKTAVQDYLMTFLGNKPLRSLKVIEKLNIIG